MKPMNPVEALRQVGGGDGASQEQAEFHDRAYGRIEQPDATGNAAHDTTLNWGGGNRSVNPGGPGDDTNFPENVAGVSGERSTADPQPQDFGHKLTSVPEDGFGAAGSWDNLKDR
jgi:hypothetical protein